MPTSLVIVESPAKARTLERYLGKGFKVLASYGHVRDLLPKSGAIDTENDFSMKYELIEKNEKAVNSIAKALRHSDTLYLATDPDREGEAISWHLCEVLKERGLLDDKHVHRVAFHEITKRAVNDAIVNPRDLSHNLIDAQQARRALDYLVGFNLSPLLWKKVQRGLSAGRVQSPSLRLIVEREEEIEQFQVREYWTIEAKLEHRERPFQGNLHVYQDKRLKQFSIVDQSSAVAIEKELSALANGWLLVKEVVKKQRKRQAAPPFITSTLQQEAARKLGFTAGRTMRIAQQLYEGVDVDQGSEGLITYMRTDSVTLAEEALTEIREYIAQRYGQGKLPPQVRRYRTKAKNAQEAHEAIRPTSVRREPTTIKDRLSDEQFKLYQLIWKRTIACQMKHATIDMVAADLACGEGNLFRANGSSIADAGFMEVYLEGRDISHSDSSEGTLPPLVEGEQIKLDQIRPIQHFTEPPPRYTEASLIKTLEEYGIGRPSTYASILHTLRHREYVEVDKKRFIPTDIGRIANKFLIEHFAKYVDYEFTARLEDQLDEISRGEKKWLLLMEDFWTTFSQQIRDKDENVSRGDVVQAKVLGTDPKTGSPVSVRMGRYGPYAQIGTKDDADKPRFASLKPSQRIDTISFEEAMELFRLPRLLGQTAEEEAITVSVGRFGPYVRYGDKFVSLKKEDDPYTITLERALELIAEKKKIDAEKQIKVYEGGIAVLNGRYGPYVSDGKKNVKIPKGREPADLSLEECLGLLAAAPVSRAKRARGKTPKAKTPKAKTRTNTRTKKRN